MRSLRRLFTRLFNTAARRGQEERLREEIAEHIALQTAENLRALCNARHFPVTIRITGCFGGIWFDRRR